MKHDDKGRWVILNIVVDKKSICIANVYGPNSDDENFFVNVLDAICDGQSDEIIVGGDLNVILDIDKDRKGGNLTMTKCAAVINQFLEDQNWVDAWRNKWRG